MALCLVVDDSEVIRLITRKILESLQQSVVHATSADEALKVCQDSQPDIVFLDWDLPSLGALDVLKGISELDTEVKPTIVLCATENDAQQFALARAAGAAHHLLKPYDLATIKAILEQAGVSEKENTDQSLAI